MNRAFNRNKSVSWLARFGRFISKTIAMNSTVGVAKGDLISFDCSLLLVKDVSDYTITVVKG